MSELREELAEERSEMRRLFEESRRAEESAKAASGPMRPAELPPIRNWGRRADLPLADLEALLRSEVPAGHRSLINAIEFVHGRGLGGGTPSRVANVSQEGILHVFPLASRQFSDERPDRVVVLAVAHEIGHLVFRTLSPVTSLAFRAALGVAVTLMQRASVRYPEFAAERLRREIFADAYAWYMLDAAWFLMHYRSLYYFYYEHVFHEREYLEREDESEL